MTAREEASVDALADALAAHTLEPTEVGATRSKDRADKSAQDGAQQAEQAGAKKALRRTTPYERLHIGRYSFDPAAVRRFVQMRSSNLTPGMEPLIKEIEAKARAAAARAAAALARTPALGPGLQRSRSSKANTAPRITRHAPSAPKAGQAGPSSMDTELPALLTMKSFSERNFYRPQDDAVLVDASRWDDRLVSPPYPPEMDAFQNDAGWMGGEDGSEWYTDTMVKMEKEASHFVQVFEYFAHPWNPADLKTVHETDLGGDDRKMAKFLIQIHMRALESISASCGGSDKRVNQLQAFDLASLAANVQHMWEYRLAMQELKEARAEDAGLSAAAAAGVAAGVAAGSRAGRPPRRAAAPQAATPAPAPVTAAAAASASASATPAQDELVRLSTRQDGGDWYKQTAGAMVKQLRRHEALKKLMEDSNDVGIPQVLTPEWEEALRADDPPMMPMMASGPPRMGKSALITLMSGFGVKLGATVVLGVGPNKTIPFSEMISKYADKLQYTPLSFEDRMQQKPTLPVGRVPSAAQQQLPTAEATRAMPVGERLPLYHVRKAALGAATPSTKPMRTTHQGLEIATRWSKVELEDGSGGTAFTAIWRRSYARDYPMLMKLGTGSAWYAQRPDLLDAFPYTIPLIGRFGVEMSQSQTRTPKRDDGTPLTRGQIGQLPTGPVRLYMFSETVADDVRAALDVAKAVYDDVANKDSWCLFIHDEVQTAFAKDPTDTRKPRPNPDPNDGRRTLSTPVAEGQPGWMQAPEILRLHREAYPLALNLKLLVSATLLPALLEKRLFGTHGLTRYEQPMPNMTDATKPPARGKGEPQVVGSTLLALWNGWHEAYDKQIHADALLKKDTAVRFKPLLMPPRGRMFYCSKEAIAADAALPKWVQRENPPNPSSNGPSYYGTMEHFEVWGGGLLLQTTPLTETQTRLFGLTDDQQRTAFQNVLDKDIHQQSGMGRFCAAGMWKIDMAHHPNTKALRDDLTNKQIRYVERDQISYYPQNKVNGEFGPLPYRIAMATVVDYPTPAFVKTMLLAKEWIDEPAREEPDPMNPSRVKRAFFPMFVLSPTRSQIDTGGIMDWAVHVLKFGWVRMHNDFVVGARQHGPPVFETMVHAGGAYQSYELKDKENYASGASARHPAVTCRSIRQLRHKYGVTVLIYGSSLNERQQSRIVSGGDRRLVPESQDACAGGGSSSVASSSGAGTGAGTGVGTGTAPRKRKSVDDECKPQADDRIISITFDPAHPHNRFASYGTPSPNWQSYEEDDVKRAEVCGPGSFKPHDVKLDTQNNTWDQVGPPLAAGDMINEAQAYRIDWQAGTGRASPAPGRRASPATVPDAMDEDEDPPYVDEGDEGDEGEDEDQEGGGGGGGGGRRRRVGTVRDQPTWYQFDDALAEGFIPRLLFAENAAAHDTGNTVVLPLEDLNGVVLKLSIRSWSDAQTAAAHFQSTMGITKVVAAGYNMFEAGTTIQCSAQADSQYSDDRNATTALRTGVAMHGPTDLNWIPKCMALAVAARPSLDMSYQHLGRCFVDLGSEVVGRQRVPIYLPRHHKTDSPWRVTLLSTRQLIPAVDLYAKLELKFAALEGMTLTSAIGHLSQFVRSSYPETTLEHEAAIGLLLSSKLGVDARLKGFHDFFNLGNLLPADPTDRLVLQLMPSHDPDVVHTVS